jgi:hypothetical protein
MAAQTHEFAVFSGEAIRGFSDRLLADMMRKAYEGGVRTIHIVDTDREVQPLVDKLNSGMTDRKLLAEAIGVIEGLAEQQAMEDDWYEEPLARFRSAVR